jgi:deoxyribodipyrimidine photo-lyase
MAPQTPQIVWFKKDLRVVDHAALSAAAANGPIIGLYIVEPELWRQPDASGRQWDFASECLQELAADLVKLGTRLIVRIGDAVTVLKEIHQEAAATTIWSHEETGNCWTYARDLRVQAWTREVGVAWHELPQNGVIRRIKTRTGWARTWDTRMASDLLPAPMLAGSSLAILSDELPSSEGLGLAPDPCPGRQRGGRVAGLERLDSFLTTRGRNYRVEMSNPLGGETACSRISPYLTYGVISMREVAQAGLKARHNAPDNGWAGSISSFNARLHWHCHFMQKLEDAPSIETVELHRACRGLRPQPSDPAKLEAWATGQTGWPFVDACMRSLITTGWLNFRMRAMMMAVASYHLWLPWQETGLVLARLFTDYEPGIHWPQVQMQSGVTGINTIRIYNPIKQGLDQDPTGAFVRCWVPELADVPDAFIHQPWQWDGASGLHYPPPIVDNVAAAKAARDVVWGLRKDRAFKSEAGAIQNKHGSRRSGVRGVRPESKPSRKLPIAGKPSIQPDLFTE